MKYYTLSEGKKLKPKTRLLKETKTRQDGSRITSYYAQIKVMGIWLYLDSTYGFKTPTLFKPKIFSRDLFTKEDCKLAIDNYLERKNKNKDLCIVVDEVEEYPNE
tara:strand:+ start:146 stop:460 length:315 start_codon:yes stop_codon:yes gene_type:complete